MALIYEHPKYGKFHVFEGVSHTSQADLESIAENCDPASGCESINAMVPLSGGIRALQIKGSSLNTIVWLYADVRFSIMGPTSTFSRADSVEIADLVSQEAIHQRESSSSEASSDSESSSDGGGESSFGLDWNDPQEWQDPFRGGGTTAGSRSEAAAHLSFAPVVPGALGSPVRIAVSEGDPDDRSDDKMALIYEHPKYGKFHVFEGVSHTSQADLESIAENCDPASGCESINAMVPLSGGIRALQIKGSSLNTIVWLYADVRFSIMGPSSTFTPATGIEVAHLVSEEARYGPS